MHPFPGRDRLGSGASSVRSAMTADDSTAAHPGVSDVFMPVPAALTHALSTSQPGTRSPGRRPVPQRSLSFSVGMNQEVLPNVPRNLFRGYQGGVRAAVVEGPGVYYMGP